jgi:acetyl-CoA acetyltransferase
VGGSGNRLAIAGLSVIAGPQPGRSRRMLTAEAARRAIADAGLEPSAVDGAVELRGSPGGGDRAGYTDGFPRMLGLPVNFYFTIGRGGALASLGIAAAASFLDRGIASYVCLASANDTGSRARLAKQQGHRGRPHDLEKEGYWGKPLGDLRAVSHHSWMAARHMKEYGTTSRQLGSIAVQTRAWANRNPEAQMHAKTMTVEDHQQSPVIVDPYHLFDVSLTSDSAIAFILTTQERAADLPRPPVQVLGQGFGEIAAGLWWEKKNYTHMAVPRARDTAFGQAGITLDDVDAAMLYDCFTAEVLFQLEDYGWCKKGEGGPFAASGAIGPGGSIPVNTSGGLLSAYHHEDLTGFAEAVRQLRGEADGRQLDGCQTVLFSSHGGEMVSPGMCSIHATTVLGTGR